MQVLHSTRRVDTDTTERLADRLADEVGSFVGRDCPHVTPWDLAELTSTARRAALVAIRDARTGLARGEDSHAAMPPEVSEFAREWARLDLPLATLLRACHVGHARVWETSLPALDDGRSRESLASELVVRARFSFGYVDRLTALLADEFARARESLARSADERRADAVRDVLAGRRDGTVVLGYDLGADHVGVVAQGEGAAAALQALARRLDRRLLAVRVGSATWAWLGAAAPRGAGAHRTLKRLRPRDGTTISIGRAARGPEGFRRTHEQACDAFEIARRRAQAVIHYDDVALETLAARDVERARQFVVEELGGLAGDDKRSSCLRETLRAYFTAGQNAAAAAAALGVHEHTVTNRLRSVETMLGRPVAARRAELETALRLQTALD
jgi:hypothetical protein